MNEMTNGAGTKDWENVSKSLNISSVLPSMYASVSVNTVAGSSRPLIPLTGVVPDDFMDSVEEYRQQIGSTEETAE